MTYVLFILMLVALILVHEFGHLLMAKLLGVKVEEFSIGFPPRIGSIQVGETKYSFGWLLFGGYVRMLGENEEPASAEGHGVSKPVSDTPCPSASDPRSFAFKSGWSQAAITVAGVIMNFIIAWMAFVIVFMAGAQVNASSANPKYISNVQDTIVDIEPNSPAAAAGLEANDVILGGHSGTESLANNFSSADFQQFTASHPNDAISLTIDRGGKDMTFSLKPAEGLVSGRAVIGVDVADIGVERLPLPLAVVQGSQSFGTATTLTAEGLAQFFGSIFTGHANFSEVSGPVGIAQLGAESIAQGWSMALLFMAIISINLAILNLIPIPGLDGGRLLFVIIERIKGSAINPELATRITIAGFALIIILMVFVTYHDVLRFI